MIPMNVITHARRWALATLAVALLSGCAGKIRSPEALRSRYADALRRDDPEAAYALLAPEVRETTPYEEFRERWKAQATERAQILESMDGAGKREQTAVHGGETVHEGDAILRWVKVDGGYQIVDGLPGMPNMSTPAASIRSLVAAIRASDVSVLTLLLGEDLTTIVHNEWKRRADTLEALVRKPGAIEYTPDMRRALLRYEPGRALTLEQSEYGWKIISIQ
ncbi:MAG: nuclear transport factor 2 family protein [Myxococcales bacterium]|nr:nuclear transport factor 2 family protein [Myxococcales bacterium]MCB9752535.1 nuclear transport factor 2 family protein [Myxococcales bacterium]